MQAARDMLPVWALLQGQEVDLRQDPDNPAHCHEAPSRGGLSWLPCGGAQQQKGPPRRRQRLEILKAVSGAFRPGVLTALVGVSGAGKTTLLDVLAGRKTSAPCPSRLQPRFERPLWGHSLCAKADHSRTSELY